MNQKTSEIGGASYLLERCRRMPSWLCFMALFLGANLFCFLIFAASGLTVVTVGLEGPQDQAVKLSYKGIFGHGYCEASAQRQTEPQVQKFSKLRFYAWTYSPKRLRLNFSAEQAKYQISYISILRSPFAKDFMDGKDIVKSFSADPGIAECSLKDNDAFVKVVKANSQLFSTKQSYSASSKIMPQLPLLSFSALLLVWVGFRVKTRRSRKPSDPIDEPKILCIIPAYNEEGSLPRLLAEVRAAKLDAVVVDDCSRDKTAMVAKAEGFPVLEMPNNMGIGGAVQAGFLYAVRNGYDIAVQIDGDGQHDPMKVAELVVPIKAGEADCIIGSRYHPSSPDLNYVTPFARKVGMLFSTEILRFVTGLTINDTTSGFRALNRDVFTFFSTEYPVDHPEAESLLLLYKEGFRILEIPTRMRCRQQGTSLFTFTRAAFYPFRVIVGFIGILWGKR